MKLEPVKQLTVQQWRDAIANIPKRARNDAEREYMERTFNALAEEQHPFDFGKNIVRAK